MALIKEDFYPKRPTRESLLDALPELSVAVYLAFAPFYALETSTTTLVLEIPFLMFLAFATFCATSGSAFVRWFGGIWAGLFFLGIIVASSVITRQWAVLYALGTLLVAHLPVLVKREKWLHRHMVGARSLLRIGCLWLLFPLAHLVAGAFSPRPSDLAQFDAPFIAAYGFLYFAFVALLDVFRILVPPPPGAGPGWWKWNAPSAP